MTGPAFGTSGLRGLARDLSDALVAAHVGAFLACCPPGRGLFVGRDLRASSPRIARAVARRALRAGLEVHECGAVPTPSLAGAAMAAECAAIMVTGSHIPGDRNGLKFYTPAGEITKDDERRIVAALDAAEARPLPPRGRFRRTSGVDGRHARGVAAAFGRVLPGWRVGVWMHATVAGPAIVEMIGAMGGEAVPLDPAQAFVAVDTEALDPALSETFRRWATEHRLDAIVSADGDGDRPLIADADGQVLGGDVIGILTAQEIGARIVVTPLTVTEAVHEAGFDQVVTTKVGSPHVIAAMAAAGPDRVVGFEANGGVIAGAGGWGAPVGTRDALLPIAAVLAAAARGPGLAALHAALPSRDTAADRLAGIDRARVAALIDRLVADRAAREAFFAPTGRIVDIDRRDGMRLRFDTGDVVHLRMSGNAPELRVYAQSPRPGAARAHVADYLARLAAELG